MLTSNKTPLGDAFPVINMVETTLEKMKMKLLAFEL